jgi:chorismate mutase
MLASERHALVNEIGAAKAAHDAENQPPPEEPSS